MVDKSTSRELNARVAVESIRGPMTNAQIMERFRITPQGFADLLKQLFQKKFISEEDLSRRGIKFKVVKPSPASQQTSVFPPPPVAHDEEFLDTVTLTDMLSFKPPEHFPGWTRNPQRSSRLTSPRFDRMKKKESSASRDCSRKPNDLTGACAAIQSVLFGANLPGPANGCLFRFDTREPAQWQ